MGPGGRQCSSSSASRRAGPCRAHGALAIELKASPVARTCKVCHVLMMGNYKTSGGSAGCKQERGESEEGARQNTMGARPGCPDTCSHRGGCSRPSCTTSTPDCCNPFLYRPGSASRGAPLCMQSLVFCTLIADNQEYKLTDQCAPMQASGSVVPPRRRPKKTRWVAEGQGAQLQTSSGGAPHEVRDEQRRRGGGASFEHYVVP